MEPESVPSRQRTVRPHRGNPPPFDVKNGSSRRNCTRFNQCPKRHARLRFRRHHRRHGRLVERKPSPRSARWQRRNRSHRVRSRSSAAPAAARLHPSFPVPKKGSSTTSPGFVQASNMRYSNASGFCVGWAFGSAALQPFLPAADRKCPVRPHLQFVVERLHRPVIERIFRRLVARCPDQRLVRIGEPRPLEIGHRIGFAPHDVVQNPEAPHPASAIRRGRYCGSCRSPTASHSVSKCAAPRSATLR